MNRAIASAGIISFALLITYALYEMDRIANALEAISVAECMCE